MGDLTLYTAGNQLLWVPHDLAPSFIEEVLLNYYYIAEYGLVGIEEILNEMKEYVLEIESYHETAGENTLFFHQIVESDEVNGYTLAHDIIEGSYNEAFNDVETILKANRLTRNYVSGFDRSGLQHYGVEVW